MASDRRAFWDGVWGAKLPTQVSWHQTEPTLSLALLDQVLPAGNRVIDVGGGASTLVDFLVRGGWQATVADISAAALAQSKKRLGSVSTQADWRVADVLSDGLGGPYDVWHDRAVFHFLTRAEDRAAYFDAMRKVLAPRGHVILATFAPQGPDKCSGLPTCQYDATGLQQEIGPGFRLVREERETHIAPWGAPQLFQYALFARA